MNGSADFEGTFLPILRRFWGYEGFRGIQQDIIKSIAEGNDTLGLMPTGGGKSITFQVPALAQDGVCIVVTPLIALMKDQVYNLRRRGIMAAAIYSGMSRHEIVSTLENCIFGHTKLLYISPERLSSDIFLIKLRHINVSFITVDEAHCISQWGYDFRPSYLKIAEIRKLKPDAPILALTATATPQVVDDIQERLEFRKKNVFSMSFKRQNLAYVVRETIDKDAEMEHILSSVQGSAIVYVRSRKRTKEIAEKLEQSGIAATFYHAGLTHTAKDIRQQRWHDDETRVMVATNAFGMGIDKPDVRMVIHYDCPDSIEAYFQEAGRAGRDGKKAYAVLLYNHSDTRKLMRRVDDTFPDKDYIRKVYEKLAAYYQIGVGSALGHTFSFEIDNFCRNFRLFPVQANSALTILERAGYIGYETEPDGRARVMFLLTRNELNRLDSLSATEDLVVTTLLRHYGGLFVDYAYIDESLVANQAGLTPDQVYHILKGLSKKNILHFIPQQKVPTITYMQEREETERVVISEEVYEKRKEQYMERINSMIGYATNNTTCRSKQLLNYFGDTDADNCHQCDVCLDNNASGLNEDELAAAAHRIMDILSDGKRHPLEEFRNIQLPREFVKEALIYVINEEMVEEENGQIWKKTP